VGRGVGHDQSRRNPPQEFQSGKPALDVGVVYVRYRAEARQGACEQDSAGAIEHCDVAGA
jgi:hypothetical protein